LTSPPFTVANLKSWGLIVPVPGSSEPPDPDTHWQLIPTATLQDGDDYFNSIRALPTDEYKIKMTVTKVQSDDDAPHYAPLVVTWPLDWTNDKPIDLEFPPTIVEQEFTLPRRPLEPGGEDAYTADDYYPLALPIPNLKDALGRETEITAEDYLWWVSVYEEEPTAEGFYPARIMDMEADGVDGLDGVTPTLGSLMGTVILGSPGQYSLVPFKVLIPSGVHADAGEINLAVFNALPNETYAIKARFVKGEHQHNEIENYKEVVWVVRWNEASPNPLDDRPPECR
jgi:hypothetical protein